MCFSCRGLECFDEQEEAGRRNKAGKGVSGFGLVELHHSWCVHVAQSNTDLSRFHLVVFEALVHTNPEEQSTMCLAYAA